MSSSKLSGKMDNLKKNLGTLPLSSQDKIELWLAYRKSKPVCLISILVEKKEDLDINLDKKATDLKQWFLEAKMFFIQDESKNEIFLVSYDQKLLDSLSTIIWDNSKKSTVMKGLAFGYPEGAVIRYAENINKIIKGNKTLSSVGLLSPRDKFILQLSDYWKWYIRYIPRSKEFEEDSKQAKIWADICREEIPDICIEFERSIAKSLNLS